MPERGEKAYVLSFAARRGDQSDQYARDQAWRHVLEKVFQEERHNLLLLPSGAGGWRELAVVQPWRLGDRMKTVAAVLTLCLNIGVDPPDVIRPPPTAVLQCWEDPEEQAQSTTSVQKFVELVGKMLQAQYELWQPRARYRVCCDPTAADIKQACTGLRRTHSGREERLLFHYNGYGVPRPSRSGEIWAFNRAYTQYVPILPSALQQWIGTPCVLVLDCKGPAAAAPEPTRRAGAPTRATRAAPPSMHALGDAPKSSAFQRAQARTPVA
eukprot:3576733-Prymnesium_polylepis.1